MKSILVLIVFCVGKSTGKVALSDLIPVCSIKDPELNSCVVKSANALIPILAKGIKDYGFPPLDPLHVSRMDVGQSTGPINLKLELINTTHYGLSSIRFHSASIDTKNNRWVLNGTLFDYSLEGRYKGNGQILLVRLIGDGRANFTFRDTGIDFIIKGVRSQEKGNVYFKLSSLRVYFKFRKSYVSLTNLFGGNRQLGEATNRFLNNNSEEVVNGMKDTLEDVYSSLYTNLVKRITSNVPLNKLFRDV